MIAKNAQTGFLQADRVARGGGWQPCLLTWYDPALGGTNSGSGAPEPHGPTASGEAYDPNKDTCAAPPSYSFGTQLTFRYSGKQVTCRVNDRGGAIQGSHFDLSRHAANTLGIIQAGSVNASFIVGGSSAAPAPGSGAAPAAAGGSGSDFSVGSVLTILKDIVTLDIGDLAGRVALMWIGLAKDVGSALNDYLLRPAWHWNQRAVIYYQENILFGSDPTPQMWTAAFWSFGYYLLWTDGKSLKPVPVTSSRSARAVRGAQGIPARASLIKPKDVQDRTAKKPKPTLSSVRVEQVGTLSTERPERVKVHGSLRNQPISAHAAVERAGEIHKNGKETETDREQAAEPHEADRTGTDSLSNSGGTTKRPSGESIGQRIVSRHR